MLPAKKISCKTNSLGFFIAHVTSLDKLRQLSFRSPGEYWELLSLEGQSLNFFSQSKLSGERIALIRKNACIASSRRQKPNLARNICYSMRLLAKNANAMGQRILVTRMI